MCASSAVVVDLPELPVIPICSASERARRMCAIFKDTACLTRVEVALSPYRLRIGRDQSLRFFRIGIMLSGRSDPLKRSQRLQILERLSRDFSMEANGRCSSRISAPGGPAHDLDSQIQPTRIEDS